MKKLTRILAMVCVMSPGLTGHAYAWDNHGPNGADWLLISSFASTLSSMWPAALDRQMIQLRDDASAYLIGADASAVLNSYFDYAGDDAKYADMSRDELASLVVAAVRDSE